MLGPKVHGGRYAKREIVVQSQFTKHPHRETWTPTVGITHYQLVGYVAALVSNGLHANILQLQVLQMGTYQDAEVHWTQVNIGLVLHTAVLLSHTVQHAETGSQK